MSEPWFSLINEGKKIVEGRPDKGDFAKMQKGDTILFFNQDKKYKVKIIDVKKYKSFEEMLEIEGLENVLPDPKIKNIEDGVTVYRKWYDQDTEDKYGVIAIHIERI